jgi:hypothetical protein
MRQLLGKIPIKYRNFTEEIYLSECVHCQNCQATVPTGIEVVTVRNEGNSKRIIRRRSFCRGHGADYATRALG